MSSGARKGGSAGVAKRSREVSAEKTGLSAEAVIKDAKRGKSDDADAGKASIARLPLARKTEKRGEEGMRIVSWNAAGLRAVVSKAKEAVEAFVSKEQPDILILQETKLQESHVKDVQDLLQGYSGYFSCSIAKKGYAGTAVFVRNSSIPKDTYKVRYGIGHSKHDQEGRSITVELPKVNLISLYVPNSGQKLERLQYRTKEWDPDLWAFVNKVSADTGKPCVVAGDLNVAHKDIDIWNFDAKHIPKTPGCTAEERQSFTDCLASHSFVDSFRFLHPQASGWYSYWSQRAGNRPFNRGLRLDYFLVPDAVASGAHTHCSLHDSFILPDALSTASDHCPVGIDLSFNK